MVNTCWCNEMATASSRCTCDTSASSKNNLNKLSSKLQGFKCRLHSLLPGLRHHKQLLNDEGTSSSHCTTEKGAELDNSSQPAVHSSDTALDNETCQAQTSVDASNTPLDNKTCPAQTSVDASNTPLDNASCQERVQTSANAAVDDASLLTAAHSSLHRDHRIWTELNIVDTNLSDSFTTLAGDQMDSDSDVIPFSESAENGHPVWEDLFDKDVTNGEDDGLTSGDLSPLATYRLCSGSSYCPGSPKMSKEKIKEALQASQVHLQEFWDAVKNSNSASHI
ncbi:hypothetical protein Btru_075187 [Bulinus truncatus]|nr:hypothetical protein Btru_075187 [Bulinus truncatus]